MRTLREHCREAIVKFNRDVLPKVPWEPRSVLASEMLAFCAVASYFKADYIIESGVYNGRSLKAWSLFFGGDNVEGIDVKIRGGTKEKITFADALLIEGDSKTVLPRRLTETSRERIAIFIDGPKNIEAIKLAKQCLEFPNVAVVGVHDLFQGPPENRRGSRIAADAWDKMFWFTDEQWFVDGYKGLDVDESHLDEAQNLRWGPYGLVDKDGKMARPFGPSYGPTIGFASNKKVVVD